MTENSAVSSTPQARRSGSRRPASADQERLVRRYLSALETNKPGRGVKRAADAVGNRITKVDELLVSADPLSRVHLTQERIELHAEYVRLTNGNHADLAQLERDFVRVVRSYGDRNGITYAAWRQVGVDAKVLEQAGILRAEKKPPPAVLRAAEQEAAGGPPAGADESQPPSPSPDGAEANDTGPSEGPEPPDAGVKTGKAPRPDGESGGGRNGSATTASEAVKSSSSGPPPAPRPGPPPGEVTLDELADLLAEAGSGPAAPARETSDQPNLGQGFETSSSGAGDAATDRPRRSPRAPGS